MALIILLKSLSDYYHKYLLLRTYYVQVLYTQNP